MSLSKKYLANTYFELSELFYYSFTSIILNINLIDFKILYTWNIVYMFTLILHFFSSVSYRAFISIKPFHVEQKLNKKTGVMETNYLSYI